MQFLYEKRKHVFSGDEFIGVYFEHLLDKTCHGKVDFVLDVELIHSGSDFRVFFFGEVGIKNVDSDAERFVVLRRLATHE